MKKILLLRTYTEILGRAISPPLGLMYLASAVREYGLRRRIDFDFKLLDLNLYGQDIRDRLGDVRAFAPHVVGITGMSYEAAAMHQTAAVLKKNLPEVRIVFGGPYASVSPLKCMQDANVDFVVVGEGEETFPDLLDSILFRSKPYQDVPGIVFRGTNGDSARTEPRGYREDVDQIPFPAWDLLDMEAYFNTERWHYFQADRRYMPIYTSRACPYRCVYCHHLFGKKFRPRSPENVFREMRYLSDAYGIKEFQIFDDAFNVQVSRAEGICDLIIRSGMKIFMTFPNGVRGDIMTDGLLEKLRRAGTYKIAYAIETASPRLQKLIKKNIDLDRLKTVILKTHKLGIITHGFFMLGFPTETREEIMMTARYALSSKLHIAGFFFVDPFDGTELADWVSQMRPDLLSVDSHDYYSPARQLSEMSATEISKIQRNLYRQFYLNPVRVFDLFVRLPQKKQVFTLIGIWFMMAFSAFRPKKKKTPSLECPPPSANRAATDTCGDQHPAKSI